MEITFRPYEKSDYVSCEALVSAAWGFDSLFESENLCVLAKYLYTKGSLVSSNYHYVAVDQGVVIGFIFGLNCRVKKDRVSGICFGLRAMVDLNFKKMNKVEKATFVDVIKIHQANRSKVVSADSNEIVLFVVSPQFQGKGVGTRLWQGFKEHLAGSGCSNIQVETNKLGASAFYEKLGFHHRADFDSPLHNLATKDGQACIYEYVGETNAQ